MSQNQILKKILADEAAFSTEIRFLFGEKFSLSEIVIFKIKSLFKKQFMGIEEDFSTNTFSKLELFCLVTLKMRNAKVQIKILE